MTPALRVQSLSKTFRGGKRALQDIDLEIGAGEMVALIGASGSGKSTLLRHVAGLVPSDANPAARIEIVGREVQRGGRIAGDIRAIRAQVGFVFQQFNLVGRLPLIVNVLVGQLHRMPLWRGLMRVFNSSERAVAMAALQRVGIAECHAQRASTLSGGQQQRAAIARALVQGAQVILADEPIASLDPESSRNVMEILARINREDGCTVVVSLHQVEMAIRYCPRVIALAQGKVVYDGASSALTPALLRELYGVQVDELFSSTQRSAPQTESASEAPWKLAQARAA